VSKQIGEEMQVLAQELSLVQDTGSWRKVFVMLQRKPMISHFVELRKFLIISIYF